MDNSEITLYHDLAHFRWNRNNTGYKIENRLIKATKPGTSVYFEPFSHDPNNPFETDKYTTMFLRFAELDCSEKMIIEFANNYGLLESTYFNDIEEYLNGEEDDIPFYNDCENLNYWDRQIFLMKAGVKIWDYMLNDRPKLDTFFKWGQDDESGDAEIFMCITSQQLGLGDKSFHISGDLSLMKDRFRKGDTLLPSQIWLQLFVNQQLQQNPSLPHIEFNQDTRRFSQYLRPNTLLGTMWLQFFQALQGGKQFKRCAICKHWEDVTGKSKSWIQHSECGTRK